MATESSNTIFYTSYNLYCISACSFQLAWPIKVNNKKSQKYSHDHFERICYSEPIKLEDFVVKLCNIFSIFLVPAGTLFNYGTWKMLVSFHTLCFSHIRGCSFISGVKLLNTIKTNISNLSSMFNQSFNLPKSI